jgi:glycosyltransferase involved in cell wall biosynthesis
MIDLMGYLDERFSLDFVLVPGKPDYIEWIKHRASGKRNIRFLDAVPMDQLVTLSSHYDIGLFLLPPTNFNYRMALPNKFFEYIQARLAIAIGPSPEMARIVQEFGCGVVAEDFSPASLAHALNQLSSADIDRMKAGSDRAARAYTAETNAEKLREIVASVLKES